MKKIIILVILCITLSITYAIGDTLRVYIQETRTSWPHTYLNQIITTQSWAAIINKENDELVTGDYFIWDYIDTALWLFSFDNALESVFVSEEKVSCLDDTSHQWYKLGGYSMSDYFWAVDFSYDNTTYVYICIPKNSNWPDEAYIWGNAYSELVWVQNFDGINLDVFVDRWWEHIAEARYVKVDGVATSNSVDLVDLDFKDEVRVLWNIWKSSVKKQIAENIYKSVRKVEKNNGDLEVNSTGDEFWDDEKGWKTLLQWRVLYFANVWWWNVVVEWENNIEWVKTLIVEGANIFISWNLRNTSWNDDILGLIAISKEGVWWNIYIHPDVTDIHASLYADKSILNYDSWELPGDISDENLANQLYIHGTIFSENTFGGSLNFPYKCPFFINIECTQEVAKKYDLNFLRRYILVSESNPDGTLTWRRLPNYEWDEAFMWNSQRSDTDLDKPWYRVYPVIIEYNPLLQKSPPPFFE